MLLWSRTETSYFHTTQPAKQQSGAEKLLISLLLLEAAHKITKVVDELNAESCSWGQLVKLAGDQFETDKRNTSLAVSSELQELAAMQCWRS